MTESFGNLTFTPDSWHRSGQAYREESGDLVSAIAQHLDAMDVERLGCNRGEHAADVALAIVVPPLKDAFREAVQNLADNVGRVGDALTGTGDLYADVEITNADAATDLGQGL